MVIDEDELPVDGAAAYIAASTFSNAPLEQQLRLMSWLTRCSTGELNTLLAMIEGGENERARRLILSLL
jgi:hypothetical protein